MKTTRQLIDDVIVPIEENSVGTKKLYDLLGDLYFEGITRTGIIEGEEWPLPSGNAPGSYRYYDKQSQLSEFLKGIRLYTISGILFKNVNWGDHLDFKRGGRLYRVEYYGESRELEVTDLVYYGNSPVPKYINSICNCIPLGLSVKKARLINRVSSWNFDLLSTFGVDCAERAYQNCIKRYGKRSINFELLIKAMRAMISDKSGMTNEANEAIESAMDFSENIYKQLSYIRKLNNDLSNSFNGLGTNYAWNAIDAAVNGRFFEAAKNAREDVAFYQDEDFKKIQQEYKLPSRNDSEFDEFTNRLYYAYMKKELDWQVKHLNFLLGEQ